MGCNGQLCMYVETTLPSVHEVKPHLLNTDLQIFLVLENAIKPLYKTYELLWTTSDHKHI